MKKKVSLLGLIFLMSCGAPNNRANKIKKINLERSSFAPEHSIKINFSHNNQAAFNINNFTKEIQKVLLEDFYEGFYGIDPNSYDSLTLSVSPIREEKVLKSIEQVMKRVRIKEKNSLSEQEIVDFKILKDFLKTKKDLYRTKIKEKNYNLYFNLIAPFINFEMLKNLDNQDKLKKVVKRYLNDLVENKTYELLIKSIQSLSQDGPLVLYAHEYDDLTYASSYSLSYANSLVDNFKTILGKDANKKQLRELKNQYQSASNEIKSLLKDSSRIIRKEHKLSKKYYQARLKSHGIFLDADELLKLAESELIHVYKKIKELAKNIAKDKGLKKETVADVLAYYRDHELAKNDDHLKETVEDANKDIEAIILEQDLITLPHVQQVVKFAGLAKGNLGTKLQQLSQAGIPQMIPKMKAAADVPFVLWPKAKVMHKKTPDFIITPSIHAISAHEGRPGHEMQQLSIQRSTYKSLIRHQIIQNTANIEGWALYAEKIIHNKLAANETEKRLFYNSTYLLRIIRVITDYKMALGLMTSQEGIAIYKKYLGMAKATAESEVNRRIQDPGRDSGYFAGKVAIERLQIKLKENYEHYSDKCFNDLVVRFSFAPAQFVERLIATSKNCMNP